MVRRPLNSSFGRGQTRGGRRGRGRTAARAPGIHTADSTQSVVRIPGNADVDIARPQRAAEVAAVAEAYEARELSAAAGPLGAGHAPPPSILANLRTRGFHPRTPFFATAERGAHFIRRALVESDREALREFSSGLLTGHFWRDSSR
ncbi:hypothetical protein U1Q18_005369, partial [Sarracenia purpurea var. burkii]